MPGYNIVGIDCDNSGNNIISLSGAIHCITHSVGVNDPLLISFKQIEDVCVDESPYVSFESFVTPPKFFCIARSVSLSKSKFEYSIENLTNLKILK